MSIEKRIIELEQKVEETHGEPRFLVFYIVEGDEQGNKVEHKPTEEAIEKAKEAAMKKNPGRSLYVLMFKEDGTLGE